MNKTTGILHKLSGVNLRGVNMDKKRDGNVWLDSLSTRIFFNRCPKGPVMTIRHHKCMTYKLATFSSGINILCCKFKQKARFLDSAQIKHEKVNPLSPLDWYTVHMFISLYIVRLNVLHNILWNNFLVFLVFKWGILTDLVS